MLKLSTRDVIALFVVLAICLITALGGLAARSVLAEKQVPIRWIEAAGPFERVSAEQIRSAAAPLVGQGFFAVDLDEVRRTVEGLPWIRSAGVRKRWPDTVSIRVLEHEPLAQWNQSQLVSEMGEVFSVSGAPRIGGLVRLEGPQGSAPEVVNFLEGLRSQLAGTGEDVVSLALSERGAWSAVLTSGIQVNLGSADLTRRLTRLTVALKRLPEGDSRRLQSLDLRYPNGLAARWQQPEEVLSQVTAGPDLTPGMSGEVLPGSTQRTDPNRPPADGSSNLPANPPVTSP
ncbi:MAG: cell division protein FtsQ/DivIB [Pseudomonadota bacterium]